MAEPGGNEWVQILRAFDDPSIPPSENWQRLASHHAQNGHAEAARWCAMRAAGHSPDECDRACRNPMDPLEPPEPERPAPRMER